MHRVNTTKLYVCFSAVFIECSSISCQDFFAFSFLLRSHGAVLNVPSWKQYLSISKHGSTCRIKQCAIFAYETNFCLILSCVIHTFDAHKSHLHISEYSTDFRFQAARIIRLVCCAHRKRLVLTKIRFQWRLGDAVQGLSTNLFTCKLKFTGPRITLFFCDN